MPIVFEKESTEYHLVLYKITFDASFYERGIDFTESDWEELERISNSDKRLQWLASRYWIKKLSKEKRTLYVRKTNLGKPEITNIPFYFSISHARDTIAIIASKTMHVSIDIEYVQKKIERIKPKFLHVKDYEHTDILDTTIIWSAKESLYKYYHSRELYSFKETLIVLKRNSGSLEYETTTGKSGLILYKVFDNLVLTWLIEPVRDLRL